jgi:hypothetical protein
MGARVAEATATIKHAGSAGRVTALDVVCACLAPGSGAVPDMSALDPGLLARIARRHQVSPLVAARLAAAGLPVPEPLRRQADAAHHRALRQMALLLDLVAALESEGIRAVPVKGVALAQQLFDSPVLRAAYDIDLVVRPEDVAAAWRVLARAGMRQVSPQVALAGARRDLFCRASKDSQHQHAASGQMLELHWRLADVMAEPLLPPDDALVTLALAPGRQVRVLGEATLFVYLCTHGAAHGWARLKWLADVAALLHRSADGGAQLWTNAERADARVAAGSAVILAQDLFGLAPPPGFVRPRGLRIATLLWLARRNIRDGQGARELEATPWRGWTEMLAMLLVAADWRGRLAVLRRIALAGEDIAQVPLPGGLVWLYPLLRVPLLIHRRTVRRRRLRGLHRVGNTTA